MADTANQVQEGDKVSWKWGDSNPSGTVSEVKAGEVSVTSHRGNEISKTGDESDPAVHISRSGNDVVKKASELTIDKPSDVVSTENKDEKEDQEKEDEKVAEKPAEKGDEKKEENGTNGNEEKDEPQVGDKRKADVAASGDKEETSNEKPLSNENGIDHANEDASDTKKQKTEANGTGNGEKRGPGRPKGGAKKEKKEKAPVVGRAERKTRSQGTA